MAGSSLLSNIFGSSSQKSANKTNLRIAQMNNEFNERMLQKQMDYNTEMWNKENEYNTAVNQAQRLRDAGLNPNIVMSGANAGTAGSAGGVTPPTASPVSVQGYDYDFSGIGQGFAQGTAFNLQEQQIQNQKEQLAINRSVATADIVEKLASGRKMDAERMYQEVQNKFAERHEQNRIQLEESQVNNMNQHTSLLFWQTHIAGTKLAQMPYEFTRFMAESTARETMMIAQSALDYARKNLTNKEIEHVKANTMASWANYWKILEDTTGVELDNNIKRETKEHIIGQAISTARILLNKSYPSWEQTELGNKIKNIIDLMFYPVEKGSDLGNKHADTVNKLVNPLK